MNGLPEGIIILGSTASALVLAFFYEKERRQNLILRQLGSTSESILQENTQLKNQILSSVKQITTLEVENQHLKQGIEEQKEFLTRSTEQLEKSFKILAAEVLSGNNQTFLTLAQQVLSKEQHSQRMDFEKRDQSLQLLLDPLRQSLQNYQGLVQEIEIDRKRSYDSIETELKRVSEMNLKLSQTTVALKDALKKPHVRGRWGEVQLHNCIELAGMSEFSDVHFQEVHESNEGQRLIPDMTVRMPGGRVVVVDAKTPMDAFIGSLEATDALEKQSELQRHGRHLKDHIKKLSQRAYNEVIPESADFTVMFLPNESFLYAALETEPDLMDFALKKQVLIVTPPTLIGLLKVIRVGWNEEKLAASAQKISETGKELHKRLCDFTETYLNVGKALEKAKQEYDTGLMRLEKRILGQAKRLELLGAKSHKHLPQQNLIDDLNDFQDPNSYPSP